MHQQSLSISTNDQRSLPARGLSAPAVLAVLCVLVALPPAAYAISPETPLLVNGSSRDLAGPWREESRELKQHRTLSRACALAVRTMMQGSGATFAGLMSASGHGLLFEPLGGLPVDLIAGPPAHPRFVEQLLDIPPPMAG